MRAAAIVVGVLAVMAVAVYAAETEVEAEVKSNVPILPGLGSGCLEQKGAPWWKRRQTPWLFPEEEDDSSAYVNELREGDSRPLRYRRTNPANFHGKCTLDRDCPADRTAYGECAGMGVVCCATKPLKLRHPKTKPTSSSSPVLQAGGCAGILGQCVSQSSCTGTVHHGLCPGAASIICCTKAAAPTSAPVTPVTPAGSNVNFAQLITIPSGINSGVNFPSPAFQTSTFGSPGCPMTAACFSCGCAATNTLIKSNLVTMSVTPTVRITGLKPFVEAVARALAAAKAAGGNALLAYNQLHTAGGFCCRPIKQSNGAPGRGYSNHSWGAAVDFYFGPNIDPRGDGKCQFGLSVIAPFFHAERLYWAAGYSGASEDSMHFEASVQLIQSWRAAKIL